MSYELVKDLLNKVIKIADALGPNEDEEVIQNVIKGELSACEYDIYIKYCAFYKAQKELELRETIMSLGTQIDKITRLYDERQEILDKKGRLTQKSEDFKRSIGNLGWIRLKIEFARLEVEHSRYVTAASRASVSRSRVSDEIDKINSSGAIAKFRNRNRLTKLEERQLKLKRDSQADLEKKANTLQSCMDFYYDILKEILVEAARDNKLFRGARAAILKFKGIDIAELPKNEQVGAIVDYFMEYCHNEESKYQGNPQSDIEEGLYPPVLKLSVIDPPRYQEYLCKFLNEPIEIEISRCGVEAGSLMRQIRLSLDVQKGYVNKISGSKDSIILHSTKATKEENAIFALVYKETKK